MTRLVNTLTTDASDDFNPGTNIPTCPPTSAGDRNCDVTSRPSLSEANSTAPRDSGVANTLTQMSSNARASRGPNSNTCVAPLNRYTAVTLNTSVYDVLNTLTSDTNGTPPCPVADAATGNVTVSAERGSTEASKARPAAEERILGFITASPVLTLDPVGPKRPGLYEALRTSGAHPRGRKDSVEGRSDSQPETERAGLADTPCGRSRHRVLRVEDVLAGSEDLDAP